ncbi:MAG: HAMP domain-containing histidine kinase, partial [Deltaproteobacteria bacterium]|nr:HAMP domain-containing histidine kinase [Deltaproteobacteria bacterium]
KATGAGTGLGLNVSRDIVERHGGRLSVENRTEGGAVFRIRLPYEILATP